MDSNIETINLGGDMDEVRLNIGEESMNYETSIPGVELLANNNKQATSAEQYENLDDLERSLDDLTNDVNQNVVEGNSNFFGADDMNKTSGVTNTWDGFGKYDNIPGGGGDEKISKES